MKLASLVLSVGARLTAAATRALRAWRRQPQGRVEERAVAEPPGLWLVTPLCSGRPACPGPGLQGRSGRLPV
eukprot:scaffold748_cov161-Prasinococcus_capsulatus_cf.AAC.1